MAEQTDKKTIAVLLASGNQGSHVIKSLLELKSSESSIVFNIIGLTRDPLSKKCIKETQSFLNMECALVLVA